MATALDTWPDVDLIESARGGNALAFAALYDRYADRVYRHVAYRVGRTADCDDLTQQTFLKAWQAMGRYRITDVPFVAWLLTIAHNSVVSYFRAKRDEQSLPDDLLKVDGRADPHAAAELRERQDELRRAISRLKPEHQQVVSMRYLEELDYADISRQLGKRDGTVRVILHRALKELRKELPEL
ncbi:MAG TPA: sigma-70 family RNA polymerase sigma factor [Chloroflexota bacterium]